MISLPAPDNTLYTLDENHNLVPETDFMVWAEKMMTLERRMAQFVTKGVRVSTVFLGMNSPFWSEAPLVFETMIFGGKYDRYQEKYTSWDDAMAGHEKAVKLVTKTKKQTI